MIDDAKLAYIIEKNEGSADAQRWVATLSLAGRDLTGANLSFADVRHVDFSAAILNRANLEIAWAKQARFDNAQLQGASLEGAQLQGALLIGAQLQGASLGGAQLQGASLIYASLQGAFLAGFLSYAQLQGASLDHAQLQGASLNGAQLQGASFVDVCAWRADARAAFWKDTRVELPKADKIHECDWTATSFTELKLLIAKDVPESDTKRKVVERIEQRLDPTKALEGEDEMAKIWAAREGDSPPSRGL